MKDVLVTKDMLAEDISSLQIISGRGYTIEYAPASKGARNSKCKLLEIKGGRIVYEADTKADLHTAINLFIEGIKLGKTRAPTNDKSPTP